MSDKRDKRAQNWATALSFMPIFGKSISQGIMQGNLSKRQKEQADKIVLNDPTYQESQYAKENLVNARNLANSRMPGATALQQGLLGSQANAYAGLSRAASNPQQMIAGAGALQQNTNSALNNLAIQEAQYTNSMFQNLSSALGAMVNEGDKVYGDQLRKFNRDFDLKQTLLNSSVENRMAALAAPNNAQNQFLQTAGQVFGAISGIPGLGGGGGGSAAPSKSMTGPAQRIGGAANPGIGLPGQATRTSSINPFLNMPTYFNQPYQFGR